MSILCQQPSKYLLPPFENSTIPTFTFKFRRLHFDTLTGNISNREGISRMGVFSYEHSLSTVHSKVLPKKNGHSPSTSPRIPPPSVHSGSSRYSILLVLYLPLLLNFHHRRLDTAASYPSFYAGAGAYTVVLSHSRQAIVHTAAMVRFHIRFIIRKLFIFSILLKTSHLVFCAVACVRCIFSAPCKAVFSRVRIYWFISSSRQTSSST